MSWTLHERGIDHVLLERDRVAERWRTSRWDALMLQFPNDVLSLPEMPVRPARAAHVQVRDFLGIGDDAAYVADHIVHQLHAKTRP